MPFHGGHEGPKFGGWKAVAFMGVMGFVGAVVVAGAGWWGLSELETEEEVLDKLAAFDPATELGKALAAGDRRFIAFLAPERVVPGVDAEGMVMAGPCGFREIKLYNRGPLLHEANDRDKAAFAFVMRYNRLLLQKLKDEAGAGGGAAE